MAYTNFNNIVNLTDKRTQVKIKKKVEVLLSDFMATFNEDDQHRACVIETIDGEFHKTRLSNFNESGIFCSRFNGHYEYFNYHNVKNIF